MPTSRRRVLWTVAAFVVLAAVDLSLSGCQQDGLPPEVFQLVQRSVTHLQAAETGLTEAGGDVRKLAEFSMHYRVTHTAEFIALRQDGERLLAGLTEAQRLQLGTLVRNQTEPILARIQTASQRFAEPQRALQMVRPLVVAGTPKQTQTKLMPFLPEVPPLPAEMLGGPPTPTQR